MHAITTSITTNSTSHNERIHWQKVNLPEIMYRRVYIGNESYQYQRRQRRRWHYRPNDNKRIERRDCMYAAEAQTYHNNTW